MDADRKLHIVPMGRRHLHALTELEKICFSQPWSEQSFEEELHNPIAVFVVAETEEGDVAGYAGMQHILDEGYIANIAVAPDMRRIGAATLLLGYFDEYARAHGLALLTLEVRRSNAAAIGAYEKAGFQEVGVRPRFYTLPEEDAFIMTKYYTQPT